MRHNAKNGSQVSHNKNRVGPQVPLQTFVRRPLAPGEKYAPPGYAVNGITVKFVCLPERLDYDGGLPGVSVRWGRNRSGFFPAASDAEFWSRLEFRHMVSV